MLTPGLSLVCTLEGVDFVVIAKFSDDKSFYSFSFQYHCISNLTSQNGDNQFRYLSNMLPPSFRLIWPGPSHLCKGASFGLCQ